MAINNSENFPPLYVELDGIHACMVNLDLAFGGLRSKRVRQIKNGLRVMEFEQAESRIVAHFVLSSRSET